MGIEGDPAGGEDAAATLAKAGRDFTDVADSIASHGREVTADWHGKASDAAFDALATLSNRTRVGAEVCAGADAVLRTYARELRAAQAQYADGGATAAAGASAAQATSIAQAAARALAEDDPSRVDAVGAAGAAAAVAGGQVSSGNATMAAAVERAEQANRVAATAIDALTVHVGDMNPSQGAGANGGRSSVSPLDRPRHGWLYNTVGGVGDGLWSLGPGLVGEVAGWSPFEGDQQFSRDVARAHQGLKDWYGADSSDPAYRNTYLGVEVASLFAGAGEVRGVEVGGEVLEGTGAAARSGVGAGEALGATKKGFDIASIVFPEPETYRGRPIVEEKSGGVGKGWNAALNDPQANTVYLVDHQQVYVTDSRSRVVRVEADLEPVAKAQAAARRHEGKQILAGGDDRQDGDQGGHLVAASLGGPGEAVNLVAMSRDQNGRVKAPDNENWYAMESDLRKDLAAKPGTDIRLDVDVDYPGASKRPDLFTATYGIDDQPAVRKEFPQ